METRIYGYLRRTGERWLISLLLLLSILEAVLAGISIFNLPGSISLNRILLFSLPLIPGLAAVFLFIKDLIHPGDIPDWMRKTSMTPRMEGRIRSGLCLGAIFFWLVAFLPFSELGRWGALYVRLQPVLILAFFAFVQLLAGWLFFTVDSEQVTNFEREKPSFLAGLIFSLVIIIIALVIGITGWGIGVGTQYWGKAGVPMLHWQIGLSLGIVLAGLYVAGRFKQLQLQNWLLDLIIFGCLWIIAFLVWQAIPLDVSRFTTRPYPPNYVSYPYSDAADYVLAAESIILGDGFQYGFIDKPIHLSFLALLRLLTGGDFGKMILAQVAFLALIPGLGYLIAAKLFNRFAGVMAGFMFVFLQSNSLAAINRIQVSNVKMMMSEPLTALMLMLVCLAVILWWRNPEGSFGFPALAGTILGLAGLVRLNALVIAPFIACVWLFSFNFKKRHIIQSMLVFSLFCVLSLVPWMVRNQIKLNNPFEFIDSKTYGVIVNNRFTPVVNDDAEGTSISAEPLLSKEGRLLFPLKKGFANLVQPMIHTGLHNLVAVSLVLPASWMHTGLDDTIRQPYWDQEWDGMFTSGGQLVFVISWLIVVFGLVTCWKNRSVVSVVPLLILAPYILSNTIALVSGGRYIVPVDWVLPLYYAVGSTGIMMCLFKYMPPAERENFTLNNKKDTSSSWLKKPELYVALGLVISCVPTVLSLSIPKKYVPMDSFRVLQELKQTNLIPASGFSMEDLQKFSENESALFVRGRAISPRWMKTGEGDTEGAGTAFSLLPFDRLSFSYISARPYYFNAVLPINEPVKSFPNASEVILVGCKGQTYLDAAVVFVLSPQKAVYTRPDITKLTCPFPLP